MIDLCVVNHNTKEKLKRLMDTLHQDDNKSCNLYLADNGSTDGSGAWMLKNAANYSRVANVTLNRNIGYATACNRAAARGNAEIIGLLNADVWLTSEDVKSIEDSFLDAKVSILGPKQRDERGRITHAGIFGTNTRPKHRDFKRSDPNDKLYRKKEECLTVSGSAYFVRRSVWDELTNCEIYQQMYPGVAGAFLPTLHYYEETWCSYHARAHGYRIFYDGSISIGHSWHASSPVGGPADKLFHASQKTFRKACAVHNIPCD